MIEQQFRAEPRASGTPGRTKIALAVCSTLFALLTVEVVLRFMVASLDFHFPTMRVNDGRFTERAGRTLEGNGVRYTFDSRGFRAVDGVRPAGDGPAILFVGDSFTEGFGVDGNETFPARACEELQRQGMRIECLNAGVTGFGTAHEARLLQMLLDRDGARVAAVVFQVLPNNDLRDNWEDGGFGIDQGRLVTWDPPHIPLPVRLRVGLLENRVAHASATIKLIANAMIGGVGIDPHYDDSAFELERRLLHEVVRVTESHHVPIVIAVCATAWELGGTRSGPYDDHARLDFVTATVEKLHVPWLDSRDVVGTSEYYIPNDGHFSAEGNAMIGRALAKLLLPLVSRGTEPSA